MPGLRRLGAEAEEAAINYLKNKGYVILERNYHARYGEVDVIAQQNDTLVFVEVRQRKKHSLVSAEESVTPKKQKKLALAASIYIANVIGKEMPIRFDVIAVENKKIRHYEGAFRPE